MAGVGAAPGTHGAMSPCVTTLVRSFSRSMLRASGAPFMPATAVPSTRGSQALLCRAHSSRRGPPSAALTSLLRPLASGVSASRLATSAAAATMSEVAPSAAAQQQQEQLLSNGARGGSATAPTFQEAVRRLQDYWASVGCLVWLPHNTEVGAGTMNPATFLR